ncbi:hypothetical protein [Massilia orientalis]|uniref:Uncharacterized protein n=1 Tax=Massilia orientalis TaxID=3050128 RepID=A0ACC7MK80_9BURK|nr:hypothetical protein [Massilia sp. YIM B02787]
MRALVRHNSCYLAHEGISTNVIQDGGGNPELLNFESFQQIASLPEYRPNNPLTQENYRQILGWYHFAEKQCCCVQRASGTLCGTLHNHGWVAKLKDGTVTILGADCANDKFGADSTVFKDISLAMNARREKEREEKIRRLVEQSTHYEIQLRGAIARLRQARLQLDEFLNSIGHEFRRRIVNMAKTGNASVVIEGVKVRYEEKSGKRVPETSVIKHTLGALEGLSAIDYQQFLRLTVEMEHIKDAFVEARAATQLNRAIKAKLGFHIERCV